MSEIERRWFDAAGVSVGELGELPDLRRRTDGFRWLDIGAWSPAAERILSDEFACHPMAVRDSHERNHIPRVHVYGDYLFVVVHAPEIGDRRHVHYLELDQFIGEDFPVTVRGPLNPEVDPAAARREVRIVIERLEAGRLRPTSSFGLAYAIGSTVVLNQLFTARHELLTIRTMAAQGGGIYHRAVQLVTIAAEPWRASSATMSASLPLTILLALMIAMSGLVLHWTKRLGWC